MSIQESFKHSKQMLEGTLWSLVYDVKEAYRSINTKPNKAGPVLLSLFGFTAGPFAVNAAADLVYCAFSKTPPAIICRATGIAYADEVSIRTNELTGYFLTAVNWQDLSQENKAGLVTNIYSAVAEAGASNTAKQDLETAVNAAFSETGMSKTEFGKDVLDLSQQYPDSQFNQMCVEVAQYFGVKPETKSDNMPTPAHSPILQLQNPAEPVKVKSQSPAQLQKPVEQTYAESKNKPIFYVPQQSAAPVEKPAYSQTTTAKQGKNPAAPAKPLEAQVQPQQNLEQRILIPAAQTPLQETIRQIGVESSQGNVYIAPRGQFNANVGTNTSTVYGSATDRTNINVSPGADNVGVSNYSAERNRGGWNAQQINIQSGRGNRTNVDLGRQERNPRTGNNTDFRIWGNNKGRNNSSGGSYQMQGPNGGYNLTVFRGPNNQFRVGLSGYSRQPVYERVPVNQSNTPQGRAYPALNDRYLEAANALYTQAAHARAHGQYRIAEILETRANAARIIYNQQR